MANSVTRVRSFYGGTTKRTNRIWEIKKVKVEKCASDFRRNPILLNKRLRIDDPLPVFRTFPRQQMAFDFAGNCHQDVHVFAKEKDNLGKRSFIVATLPMFWYMYTRVCSPEERNYYEVIPEGAACRLYFDLEFKTELNPGKDGDKMLEIFIKYVCHHLKEMYGLNCDRRFIVDLDSSTSFKFSRHLIFHMPGAVFKDNIHAGHFVRHICALLKTKLELGTDTFHKQLAEKDKIMLNQDCDGRCGVMQEDNLSCSKEKLQSSTSPSVKDRDVSSLDNGKGSENEGVTLEEMRELIMTDGKGGFGIFCDQGVYTKNRNFRLFKSTKMGKKSHLVASNQNTFKPSLKDRKGSFSKDPEYLLFLDSLVSNVSMQVGGKDVKVLTCESCEKSCKTNYWTEAQDSSISHMPSHGGYEHSPYAGIDKFIFQVVNKGGVQGEIRRWVFFPQGKLLTYDILKNRWCENIGRPHKSNNIMIVVDLKLGVYYQKCHDPDCKSIDYRSPERPFPEEINPLSNAQSGEFFGCDEDDQDLCNAVAEIEALGYDHANCTYGLCSPEKQESSNTNNCRNGDVSPLGSKRSAIQDGMDFDDEVSDEALLEADVQQGNFKSAKIRKASNIKTVEAPQASGSRECLKNGKEVPATLAEVGVHSESALSAKTSLERSGADDNLDSTFDEDVSACIDEDPVSDLELSFAAEEVENRS